MKAVNTALTLRNWLIGCSVHDALDRWLPWLGRLGLIERATTLDLTPTVLHALGHPVGRDMAGRPLAELLAAGEPTWVDSYDVAADPETDRQPPEEGADDEVLERLEALGFWIQASYSGP